jgi:S1-C subfamily serine protease
MKTKILLILLLISPLVPIQFAKLLVKQANVVQIYSPDNKTAGTGFHVKALSGAVYILTNKHVCEGAIDGELLISTGVDIQYRKVVAIAPLGDLCLVKPTQKIGIDVAEDHSLITPILQIGYGGGNAASSQIAFMRSKHIVPICNRLPPVDEREALFGGKLECVLTQVYAYDFLARGGASGSPIMSLDGELVSVLFASHDPQAYGVPLNQIQKFLQDF